MRALISVSDKSGVAEFARSLVSLGWEIISTSGTMRLLKEAGIPVTAVSDVTGFPEICDGRVKTLHPRIHGALLARRNVPEHMKALEDNKIETIDMVCVNLYPFRETIAREGVTMEDAVENIDIGGPSMLRSAAKNWESVTVVCMPSDYETVLDEIRQHGNTTRETRLQLSAKAYTHTAEYDMAIAAYMRAQSGLPEKLFLDFDLRQELRYGENPHQKARFYSSRTREPYSLATAEQLNGKELSYNNIQDANATLNIVREFTEPFCCGVKHMNPCGAAVGSSPEEAWRKTYEADKTSIFGGIVAFNREVDLATAELLKPLFLEVIMAPSFSPEALDLLCTKKNLRILKVDMETPAIRPARQLLSVNGGLLVQDRDSETVALSPEQCVTKAKPSAEQLSDMDPRDLDGLMPRPKAPKCGRVDALLEWDRELKVMVRAQWNEHEGVEYYGETQVDFTLIYDAPARFHISTETAVQGDLVTVLAENCRGEKVRIISARRATKKEAELYGNN